MKKSGRIVKIEFSSPPRAVITFADGSSNEVSGLLATKWRAMLEATVHYERAQLWSVGITDFWKYVRTRVDGQWTVDRELLRREAELLKKEWDAGEWMATNEEDAGAFQPESNPGAVAERVLALLDELASGRPHDVKLLAIESRAVAVATVKFETISEFEDAAEQAFADRATLLTEVERLRQITGEALEQHFYRRLHDGTFVEISFGEPLPKWNPELPQGEK